ncbi:MAG: hypothetical protein ACJA08_001826 [Cyclobacteriaceae bacterium]|jgi:hypothetical protein
MIRFNIPIQLKSILVFLGIASLIFSSCEENTTESNPCDDIADCQINIGEIFLEAYSGSPYKVTLNGETQNEWTDFKIIWTCDESVIGGTYELSSVPKDREVVWGDNNSNGDWYFNDPSGETIMLADLEWAVVFTASQNSMTFTMDKGDRSAFNGIWVFT